MPVRSKQFVATRLTSNALVTLYTVPADRTVILKHVALYSSTAITALLLLEEGGVRKYFVSQVLAADGVARLDMWLVAKPGQLLRFHALGTVSAADLIISGAELAGVAPA